MDYAARLQKFRENFISRDLDSFLIVGKENVHYLTGFTGENGWILLTKRRACFITDFRFLEQAQKEVSPFCRVVEAVGKFTSTLEKLCRGLKLRRLGFAGQEISYAFYRGLKESLRGTALKAQESGVGELRKVKDAEEVELVRDSARLLSRLLARVVSSLTARMTERMVADRIVGEIRRNGGYPAFEPIVAGGAHSSQPHAVSGDRPIRPGEIILVDAGARFEGYCSDCTRTFAIGAFVPRFQKIYQAVLNAQRLALEAIAPGVKASAVDSVARDYLRSKGYGSHFGHSLGHGVGLEVHEPPTLNPRSGENLQAGMICTVEPGVYIPGWGAVRIEDTVLVTEEGCEVLTCVPKGLDSALIRLR